mgnify:CR=1 FL=1
MEKGLQMLIGLTGYARSGKDSVAEILVKRFGFKRVAFADPIRELLYELNPQIGSLELREFVDQYGWDVAKANPKVREMLQNLGVGARKLFHETFWIEQALKKVQDAERIVVTDVRFKNEANWIKGYESSQIWRIKRLNTGAINDHVSEAEMDDYKVDQIFINHGTLDDLDHLVVQRMIPYLGE